MAGGRKAIRAVAVLRHGPIEINRGYTGTSRSESLWIPLATTSRDHFSPNLEGELLNSM